jgi:hypothetical protein
MSKSEPKFRKAFVAHTATFFDFSGLKDMCDEICFIVTGYETAEQLFPKIVSTLKDYDPALDIVVPVGSVITNMLVGMAVEDVRLRTKSRCVTYAVWRDKDYEILSIAPVEMS